MSEKRGSDVAVNVLTAVMGTVITLFFGIIMSSTWYAAQGAKAEAADNTKTNARQEAQISAMCDSVQRIEKTVTRLDEKVSDLYVYISGSTKKGAGL